MTDLVSALADQGIRLRSYDTGEHRTTCPVCSATRKKKSDPCLAVKIDDDGGATWHCHHCEATGNVASERQREAAKARPRKAQRQTEPPVASELPAKIVQWFADRGISKATLERNRIGYGPAYIPGAGGEAPAIQFPFLRGGVVVNVKFRDGRKNFAQVKGAEKIFYGLDDIAGAETVIIVEGEPDKLALEEAGYLNVISVPDGAPAKLKDGDIDPEDDRKFEYVWNCRDELAGATKIVLACDADEPGRVLTEELARRLGRERCWRVTWPTAGDAPRKDANEVLVEDGAEVVRECIEAAQPYPIRSLHDLGAFESETLALFEHGAKRAFSTGWPKLDRFMKIREGELSIVTGVPGSGKSEFVDALMLNLARAFGWRFAVCSFENPPTEHIAKLAEKHLGMPFWPGPRPRMGDGDLREAIAWLREHFYLIRADDEAPTMDWLLEAARGAVMRYGIRGLVIDPYNELEHRRPISMSETEYVSQVLGKVKRFAQRHGVHVWFIAHPAKMRREEGKFPVPSLYDISGSANWVNKADLGVVVHRDPTREPPDAEIHVRKVRFKAVGKVGSVTLSYDRATGRYYEKAA